MKNHIEYYYKDKKTKRKNGRYLRKDEIVLAKAIAQRDYDEHLLKNITERISAIEKFLRKYKQTNLKEIYQKTNIYRQALLKEKIISDEEYIAQ